MLQFDLDPVAAGPGFRSDSKFLPMWQDQEAALGSSVFDGNHHERFDQLLQHNLPSNSLRRLHYRPQVQLLNRRADGGDRAHGGLLFDRSVALVELLYLAQCAPSKKAVAP